jgi:outer membrane biosynthesis protein TonB
MDKKKKTGEGLYKKRYATLKEHRAAVAAQKTTKGGKNVGPVAHGGTYAKAMKKKPAAPKAEAKPTPAKPKPAPAKPKPTPAKPKPTPAKTPPKAKPTPTKAKPTPREKVKAPSRTSLRQRNRRSSSTSQSRATRARQRSLAKNQREQRAAELKRLHYPKKK